MLSTVACRNSCFKTKKNSLNRHCERWDRRRRRTAGPNSPVGEFNPEVFLGAGQR